MRSGTTPTSIDPLIGPVYDSRMIAILDPHCTQDAHEKVNSGFILGLRLAFPDEKIRFYAERSHLDSIRSILAHDRVVIPDIEYIPVPVLNPYGFSGFWETRSLLKDVFKDVLARNGSRVFVLTHMPPHLFWVKVLKLNPAFRALRFAFVLHGSFERIAGDRPLTPPLVPIPASSTPVVPDRIKGWAQKTILEKAVSTPLSELRGRVCEGLRRRFDRGVWEKIIRGFLHEKSTILWRAGPHYRFIFLSPHIPSNASRFIDLPKLNHHVIVLPTVFRAVTPMPLNNHPRFAVFGGSGISTTLYNVALELSKKGIKSPFEIRIIGGMDNRSQDRAWFPFISRTAPERPLSRREMEEQANDIDVFLVLYGPDRYRLSCSSSMPEALSNCKPVLFLENDCSNFFSSKSLPIGEPFADLASLTGRMAAIIENFDSYRERLLEYRENILTLRERFDIRNSVDAIRKAFTW